MDTTANNSNGRIIIGSILIFFGLIFFINNFQFQLFNIDLFSWPIIFTIFGIIIIINNKNSLFGFALIAVGILGIVSNHSGFSVRYLIHEYWPLLLIIFGIVLIFQKSRNVDKSKNQFIETEDYTADVFTFLGEFNKIIKTNKFHGGRISSIMGETQIDLRNSHLANEIVELDNLTLMASTEIYIPADWKVIIKTTTIFGAFEDLRTNIVKSDSSKTLVVKGLVLFGGGEIK
ncbi:MAG: hypothetical protein IPM32_08315 [Ignavibacteriae bacterium]|nr:hypothetical protein [Ignavibacteriota bacterium]